MSGYEDAQAALAAGAEIEVAHVLPPMRFQCGCRTESNPSPAQISTDAEGFVICAVHGARRYGWRSMPPSSDSVSADFRLASYTELERERYLIFGEKLPRKTVALA